MVFFALQVHFFCIQTEEKKYLHMSLQCFVACYMICHWHSASAVAVQQSAWSGLEPLFPALSTTKLESPQTYQTVVVTVIDFFSFLFPFFFSTTVELPLPETSKCRQMDL